MNNKGILLIVAVIVAAIAGIYYFSQNVLTEFVIPADQSETTSGMRVEDNAIVVTDQRPGGSITVSSVFLAKPGFVAIYEDNDGTPGVIIGTSALLPVGESDSVNITLSRASKDGEILRAMLHSDSDGDGSFTNADLPVQSILGGPIEAWFEVAAGAGENIPVSI
ncbi:MAG: hypothetical protein Q7S01_04945 [bacterium]|nr:hypothetical protein [bacterium]